MDLKVARTPYFQTTFQENAERLSCNNCTNFQTASRKWHKLSTFNEGYSDDRSCTTINLCISLFLFFVSQSFFVHLFVFVHDEGDWDVACCSWSLFNQEAIKTNILMNQSHQLLFPLFWVSLDSQILRRIPCLVNVCRVEIRKKKKL